MPALVDDEPPKPCADAGRHPVVVQAAITVDGLDITGLNEDAPIIAAVRRFSLQRRLCLHMTGPIARARCLRSMI
jgi:hypothetical protein